MKTKSVKSRLKLNQRRGRKPDTQRTSDTITSNARPSLNLKRILVPIDFSEHSLKAARYAARFAGQFGASIYLVYVLEKSSFLRGESGIALRIPDETMARRAQSRLASLACDEIEELIPVTAEVRSGKPFEQIVKFASSKQVDLIVISTRGYTGLKHVMLGSTAERVVRYAPCPVLVVREDEREFA